MNPDEQSPGSGPDRAIEHGETYDHAEHGLVEVTGIWQRTRQLETATTTDEHGLIVVRFVPEGGGWFEERAESLDEFLAAIDPTD